MAIILFNPTGEDLVTQYVGEDVLIAAGTKIRVDDPRGRHVLNVLGPRGLMTLEYGDEGEGEDKKAVVGRQRNKDFKFKQVIDFNTLNEQRFQSRLPYIKPPSHIKTYSDELGIELRQPYAVEDAAKKDMSNAMQRNQELEIDLKKKDSEISELREQVTELMTQFRLFMQKSTGSDGQPPAGSSDLIGKWKTIGANNLAGWIEKNWDEIQLLPDDAMQDLEDRYQAVYKKKMPKERDKLAKAA